MIPRNRSRHIILAFSLAFVALASARPIRTDALATHLIQRYIMTKGYCASGSSGSVVYVSNIFEVVNTRPLASVDTSPLNAAFKNYLVEEYDFKSNSNFSVGCRVFETLSQAEANKREIISQAQQGSKQIVELNWNPGPIVAVERGDSFLIGPKGPPRTHTFCAVGHDDTMYFSDVFVSVSTQNYKTVGDAFNDFLRERYGFEPQVDATCTPLNTVREGAEVLKARIGGVRYNKHKAVETGWKYGSPLPLAVGRGTTAPTKPLLVVDDVEPPPVPIQRPKPPPAPASAPTQSLTDFAAKEGPLVLAYCQKDPKLSKFFDCDRVRLSVSNYRMEHGSSEPLASLFTEEKVNLAYAIDNTLVGIWVRARATTGGVSTKFSNCVEQKFNVSFYEKPYISQMQKIYDASVAACK